MTPKPDEREAVVTDERFVAAAALRDLAEAATAQAAAMRQGNRRYRLALMQAARAAATDRSTLFVASGPGSGFEDRAVGGRANPTSVDLDVDFKPDEVVAKVVLHRA